MANNKYKTIIETSTEEFDKSVNAFAKRDVKIISIDFNSTTESKNSAYGGQHHFFFAFITYQEL